MEKNKPKIIGTKVEESGKTLPIKNPTELKHVVENDIHKIKGEKTEKNAESAVAPKAWENQEKAYNDAWEKYKNQTEEE